MPDSPWNHTSWAEVDPATHPFDPAEVLPYVESLPQLAELPPPRQPWGWTTAVSTALAEHFGWWTYFWDLLRNSPATDIWCCGFHSITTPAQTAATIARSVIAWRQWIERTAERMDRFLPLPADPDDLLDAWEIAATDLIGYAIEQFDVDDGWQGVTDLVLHWFLDLAGVPAGRSNELIATAVGGRFRSHTRPSQDLVLDVATRLAAEVTGRDAARWPDTWPRDWPRDRTRPSPAGEPLWKSPKPPDRRPDALTAWLRTRAGTDWATITAPVTGPLGNGRDGLAEYAAARGLSPALEQARASAAETPWLHFHLLAGWQRTVLGVADAPFRTTAAVAKQGREVYHWRPDLPQEFDRCLWQAVDARVPLPSRAARAYLDVAFYHPFDDGNARAAMLTLAFLLAREGVVLDRAEPLLMLPRHARDELGAAGTARLLAILIDRSRTGSAHR
jgi:hypothetical protein